MAKAKTICAYCDTGKIEVGSSFCGRCGQPTEWASYDERVAWELDRWRDSRGADGKRSDAPQPRPKRAFLHALRRRVRGAASTDTAEIVATPRAPAERNRGSTAGGGETPEPAPAATRNGASKRTGPPEHTERPDVDGARGAPASAPDHAPGSVPDPDRIAEILARLASYASQPADPAAELTRARADLERLEARIRGLESRSPAR